MTKSGEDEGDRLDKIEALLLLTATRLNQVAQQQQINTDAIAQLTQKVDNLTTSVEEGFAQSRTLLQECVDDLAKAIVEGVEGVEEMFRKALQQGGNGNNPPK
ncbi:hypothetical protein [Tolypothrix sp. VBCCA 56010]|uniref:hypothetical protein n=1 Tax=Tolypothrix sp. VBCCA 56010 TaxID=3137731 RepID=UPI003D7CDDB5